jgi:hypothetical protein
MNSNAKYIGMDVHKESISIAVRNAAGKIVMECVIETIASMILQFFDGLRGELHVTFEEGTWAAWLYDLLRPHVTNLIVCDPRRNALLQDGNQNDRVDARKLSDLLYMNKLSTVYHGDHGLRNAEGTGAELSDHHPGPESGDDPRESHLSQLGYSLQWQAGLWLAASDRVADQDRTTRSAPAGGVVLPAAGGSFPHRHSVTAV